MLFLGQSTEYWIELQRQVEENGPAAFSKERLIAEMAALRAKVSFYESRISELNQFMSSKLEVTR